MRKSVQLLPFFLLSVLDLFSQGYVTMVIDYRLGAAITSNTVVTVSHLNKIKGNLDEIKAYQHEIAAKKEIIFQVDNKMYKSKFSVADEVRNGHNVISALEIVKHIGEYQVQMIEHAKADPKLLLVAYKAETELIGRIADLMVYIQENALKGGDDNLISGKQRMEIIRTVLQELKVIRGIAYMVNRRMGYASKVGVLKAVNPFGLAYPNEDLQIIKKVLK